MSEQGALSTPTLVVAALALREQIGHLRYGQGQWERGSHVYLKYRKEIRATEEALAEVEAALSGAKEAKEGDREVGR